MKLYAYGVTQVFAEIPVTEDRHALLRESQVNPELQRIQVSVFGLIIAQFGITEIRKHSP